jgi:hypothetical protein
MERMVLGGGEVARSGMSATAIGSASRGGASKGMRLIIDGLMILQADASAAPARYRLATARMGG